MGLIRFTGPNNIEEDGVLPGDDYREMWWRFEETSANDFTASVSVTDSKTSTTSQKGYFIRVGNVFAFTLNRPDDMERQLDPEIRTYFSQTQDAPLPPSEDLLLHLKKYVTVLGSCSDWKITHSLHPDMIGHSICLSECQHDMLSYLLRTVELQIVAGLLPDNILR